MPAVQTTYPTAMVAGYAGEIADLGLSDVISREVETGTIGFGLAVVQGTLDHQCKLGGGGVFLGITVRDVSLPSTRNDAYAATDTAAIMREGVIFAIAGEAVNAGDAVYRTAAGVLNKTSASNTLIVGARWETSAANGALAKIRLT